MYVFNLEQIMKHMSLTKLVWRPDKLSTMAGHQEISFFFFSLFFDSLNIGLIFCLRKFLKTNNF